MKGRWIHDGIIFPREGKPMNIDDFNKTRKGLNELMCNADDFFNEFGKLDDSVYSEGAIPKRFKELTGLAISVLTRCEECVMYHIQGCLTENATKEQVIEAIKLGVIAGGSITYPTARFAFGQLRELKVIT
jgi:AhpD family alkylhydroperoxidase